MLYVSMEFGFKAVIIILEMKRGRSFKVSYISLTLIHMKYFELNQKTFLGGKKICALNILLGPRPSKKEQLYNTVKNGQQASKNVIPVSYFYLLSHFSLCCSVIKPLSLLFKCFSWPLRMIYIYPVKSSLLSTPPMRAADIQIKYIHMKTFPSRAPMLTL